MTFFFPTQHKIIQVVACINSLFLFIAEEYYSQRKAMTNLDSIFKSRDNTLPIKVHLVKAMVFPVVMYTWELDRKEGWMPKNWCFWIEDLEKALESPLDSKESKPVNSTGNQLWIFIGGTDAEAGHLMQSWLLWKHTVAGKDWGQEEKWVTEGEIFGWHHWFNEPGFEQTPGDGEGQGSLACCSP